MASAPISNCAAENDGMATQDSEEQEYILKAGWKTLFGFTTKQHLPVLCGALLGAFFAALTMPILAIIYGLIFQEYTNYGLGTADSSTLMSNVTKYCVILTGVATLNWIANSLYFFFFLTFGELQARSARTRVFETLIKKDIGWFDTRETGVAAFLPRIQM
jgi:ATP-binding cassette subfamily B (MDR/TAP) protein 1